ncbi:hypothetical protein M0D69_36970 [Caballeronia sp. SEWSISQ10-4 2]|uniref:hypothetical protein n=1 Tax=Caballeronia sp. SEWSISQ10-4 2 TaxID=2937438 RepID=UPI00264CFE00|nr:hypothetical protein [Caballeronia sp. SEWSISQ10-4 2]MDN7183510.1 hypothetical protein [Caballeronia sp. SEWSISQ10-4 2]
MASALARARLSDFGEVSTVSFFSFALLVDGYAPHKNVADRMAGAKAQSFTLNTAAVSSGSTWSLAASACRN